MKTIILGREGEQPFSIGTEHDGVSRQHARVTITDRNLWYLEDLDSSNGTYIRDEDSGEMLPVSSKTQISPMTFIFLGPDNSRGCCFFAEQILLKNYGNFKEEYEYLNAKEDEFDGLLDKLEDAVKWEKIVIFVVNVLVAIVSLIPQIDSEIRFNLLRIVPIVSTGFAVVYDAGGKKKKIKEQREKFHQCPNPTCSHRLKPDEIRNYRCSKCKK